MKAIVCDGAGDESVMRWAVVPDPECGPGEVLLSVRSTSVNRADLLQRQGFYPSPPGASSILGLEAAGTVVKLGDGVRGWKVGDQAMALLSGGGYAEIARADARHLMPIPAAVGVRDAGAVPEVFITAYFNLIELAHLQPGERLLIHGGGGGVGTAALQLARHLAADVWVTAGTHAKLERCRELGAAQTINYREEDFVDRISTAGGADVILDCLGASYLERNVKALASGGRLVIIGLQGGTKAEFNLARLLNKRATVAGSVLRPRSPDDKAAIVARFAERILPLLDDGTLVTVVDTWMDLNRAADGHRLMDRSGHFGKIVLVNDV